MEFIFRRDFFSRFLFPKIEARTSSQSLERVAESSLGIYLTLANPSRPWPPHPPSPSSAGACCHVAMSSVYPVHKLTWNVSAGSEVAVPSVQPLLRSKRGFAGQLLVTVKRAELQNFGRSFRSLVCQVVCGESREFSSAAEGTLTPAWDHSFALQLDGDEQRLEVTLLDKSSPTQNVFVSLGRVTLQLQTIVPILNPSFAEDVDVDAKEEERILMHLDAILENARIGEFRKAHIRAALTANVFKPQSHWVELRGVNPKTKQACVIGRLLLQMCFIPNRKAPVLNAQRRMILQSQRAKRKQVAKARARPGHKPSKSATTGLFAGLNLGWAGKQGRAAAVAGKGARVASGKKLAFGRTVAEDVKDSKRDVPEIIYETVTFLTKKGLTAEGLFRVPGNADRIRKLQAEYDQKGSGVKFEDDDTHVCAGLLKLYFRSLKEPIVPHTLYPKLLAAAEGDPEKRNSEYRRLLDQMSGPALCSLGYLCRFLNMVATYQLINRMGPDNLAVVFAPNILVPEDGDPTRLITEIPKQIKCLTQLIKNSGILFVTNDEKQATPKEKKAKEVKRRASLAIAHAAATARKKIKKPRGVGMTVAEEAAKVDAIIDLATPEASPGVAESRASLGSGRNSSIAEPPPPESPSAQAPDPPVPSRRGRRPMGSHASLATALGHPQREARSTSPRTQRGARSAKDSKVAADGMTRAQEEKTRSGEAAGEGSNDTKSDETCGDKPKSQRTSYGTQALESWLESQP